MMKYEEADQVSPHHNISLWIFREHAWRAPIAHDSSTGDGKKNGKP
jgi:hypothetical protein